ncbi:hypothetical protein QJS10_CPB17g01166 [Acorus calamus]|uniref:3'-5' exonuclease domain-containing protein n=1 Tax=Acorus calamus TaxID=4465 RepID=A0AAV9CU26_ACOCL|nr:hypothetical protein QJS10_CPB17g01166 [Acorus calamus]
MGSGEVIVGDHKHEQKSDEQTWTVSLHTFLDLSHVSPATFVFLLKECYMCGTIKASLKFRVLQKHVLLSLYNKPQPGPGSFIIQCLYVIPLLGPAHTEGFSHLLLSSFRCFQKTEPELADLSKSKCLVAQLFLDVLTAYILHEERILVKILEIFDVGLEDIAEALCGPEVNGASLGTAMAFMENYIFGFIESQSYMTAVTLLERFSIQQSGQSFLLKMIEDNQYKAAEKWATFMGKPMLCLLVQKYVDMKMLKGAYNIVKQHNLKQEFPNVCYLYKESSIKKLAEKGCWDVAEFKTNNNRQLLEYLVYLAMEAGYTEKVDELCGRYSLQGFVNDTAHQVNPIQARYLHHTELSLEAISWVDGIDGLSNAMDHIEGCKVVGVDCEWKPNYEKGSRPNKVSIMQIASEKRVFIFDLIKLYEDEPKALNNCFKRILQSSKILKLGYNLQCDLHHLSYSYGDLECFKHFEMLLDIQKLFKDPKGGLSALTEKILGAGLNKTRRNSNWEQRPLSQNQIEYAALDAAVLVRIFHHVRAQSQPTDAEGEGAKMGWKSHIVSN